MLIDYQSKRRDVYTAAQRLRSDGVVMQKIFTGGWASAEKFEYSYHASNVHIRDIRIDSTHPSGVLPSSYEYIM